jgi:hypothetical protein
MRRLPILCASSIAMATAANATTLAAGGLYGGPTQGAVFCYFFNAGTSSVTISGKLLAFNRGISYENTACPRRTCRSTGIF